MKPTSLQRAFVPILLGVMAFLSPSARAQADAELIAWWNMDSEADSVAGIPAELDGEAKFDPNGWDGQGLNVDQGPGSLKVADASFMDAAGDRDQITFSFWQRNVSPVRDQSSFWALAEGEGGDRAAQAHTPWSDGTVYFDTAGCCDGGTQRTSQNAGDVNWDEWNHFAFVKNVETKQIYINGELLIENTNTNPLPAGFTELYIGSASNSGNNAPAILDDFAIYAGALTAEEVQLLADGGSPLFDTSDPGLGVSSESSLGQVPSVPDAHTGRFTVRNPGETQTLTITAINLSGTHADNFTIDTAVPLDVPPGGKADVGFTFSSKGASGLFTAEATFASNDANTDEPNVIVLKASVINRAGPAAYYTMDAAASGPAPDTTGFGRDGSYQANGGAATFGNAGLAANTGTAVGFSGGSQVVVPGSSLNGVFDRFTISLLLNAADLGDIGNQLFGTIFAQGLDSPTFGLLLGSGELLWFGEADGIADVLFATDSTPIQLNTTHHIAVTYDGASGSTVLYVDGAVAAEAQIPPIPGDGEGDFYLGSFGAGALGMNGQLDDVQIYDRVLTAENIVWLKDNPGGTLADLFDIDSDGDGLSDREESELDPPSNPLVADSDGDTLPDGDEVNIHLTSPSNPDSDGDGVPDNAEIESGSDPNDANSVADEVGYAGVFTGPAAGLDFEGDFAFAVNILGPGDLQVGDALFTNDRAQGVSVTAQNQILNWEGRNDYGDGTDADNLETVMHSIRWSAQPDSVNIDLALPARALGARLKVQILFAEKCCDRGWDIVIEDEMRVDDFSARVLQDGTSVLTNGAVYTFIYNATDDALNIVLGGENSNFADGNAIVSGVTVEILSAPDSDNDGMSDEWERLVFGNITDSDGTGDADSDGLTDLAEHDAGTDAMNADTDGDGLNDGDEVAFGSDFFLTDTDNDGLSDKEEQDLGTDPTKRESDGDGFPDGFEVAQGTDPSDPSSFPGAGQALPELPDPPFTTGKLESLASLDLEGNILHAVNIGGPDATVLDARFLADDPMPEGISWSAQNHIAEWLNRNELGDGDDADNLETVLHSIRWSGRPEFVLLDMSTPVPGQYKLQLLFSEKCCDRGYDIFIEDELIVDDYSADVIQESNRDGTVSAFFTYTFNSKDEMLNIKLGGPDSAFADGNAILSGATLELIQEGSDGPPPRPFDLAAYWDFNVGGVPVDSVQGITGELEGDAAVSGEGTSGTALDLTEGSGTFKVTDVAFINELFATDEVTVVFWQKLRTVTDQTTFKAQSPSSNGAERGWSVHTPWGGNDTIFFDTVGCCDGATQRMSKATPEGLDYLEWNHFGFVKNGDTKQIWVNGELHHEAQNTSDLPDDITALWIGSAIDGGESTDGWLDDFAIYGKALPAAAFQELTAGALPNGVTDDSEPPPPPTELQPLEVGRTDAGAVSITIADGQTVDIEYSTDLQNWSVIQAGASGTFEDTDAGRIGAAEGYYRGRQN